MNNANVYVRSSYRIHIDFKLANDSGNCPVKTIANHEMTATT
jgi:hypothetical protein